MTKKTWQTTGRRLRGRRLGLLALAAAVPLLSGCAPGRAIDPHLRAMAARPAAPTERDFPATDTAPWKQGAMAAPPSARPIGVQPLPSPPPVPLPPQKISLGADGLFRSGGGTLTDMKPEGRQKVEQLAQEIRRKFRTIHSISVTSHTDRLGSAAYNDALSIKRANTVRDLLVRAGIEEELIRALGVGKSRPMMDCLDAVKIPALVACTQPDRRVEVEVRGAL